MKVDPSLEELLKTQIATNQQRFDKIEAKIDALSEVVVALARAETKLVALEESRTEQGKRLGRLETELFETKEEVNDNTDFRTNLTRAFWIFLTAAATVTAGVYFT